MAGYKTSALRNTRAEGQIQKYGTVRYQRRRQGRSSQESTPQAVPAPGAAGADVHNAPLLGIQLIKVVTCTAALSEIVLNDMRCLF